MITEKNYQCRIDQRRDLDWYAFEGLWGEVVLNARYFFAWKDGYLIGTYKTLEEAIESLCAERKG